MNRDLITLTQIRHRFDREKIRVNSFRSEESSNLEIFGISIEDVYPQEQINLGPIDGVISEKQNRKLFIELQLGMVEYSPDEHNEMVPREDELLSYRIGEREAVIQELSKTLDEKERSIEDYKDQLSKWEKLLADKVGDDKNPAPGTLNHFKQELNFILNDIDRIIEEKKLEREAITKGIYSEKKSIIDIYSNIKSNIDKKLANNMEGIEEYEISLEASLQIRNFVTNFLDFIDKVKSGSFRGQELAEAKLKEILEATEANDEGSMLKFISTICDKLEFNEGVKQNPFHQIKESKELKDLYDYLFGLKYLDEKYELKFSGKSIEQLSPGERGAALIVFYLLLDKDDKPLIIDQPEDNLDNQSVYQILVPFIRQAKKKRQLIIVTHNPNLAVVADAEQIIHVELDKKNQNEFSFKSGGIENPEINKGILDILEGTKPAFDKRKLKYLSK